MGGVINSREDNLQESFKEIYLILLIDRSFNAVIHLILTKANANFVAVRTEKKLILPRETL